MKYFVLSLALASMLSAAEFRTGQAARAVIGQETFTRQKFGAGSNLLGAVGGVAYANNTLFIVDSSRVPAFPQNNRVLIFQNVNGKMPSAKQSIPLAAGIRCPVCNTDSDFVLGQPDFTKSEIGLTQSRFRNPTAVATDGQRLVVADTDNNRVLIWNTIPTANETPASVVVGQKDFTTAQINFGQGGTPNAQGLRGPQGVWIQGSRLYVADTQNNRVLIWNSIPTQNGQAADLVLGAANFTTFVQPNLQEQDRLSATASTLLNPVSVTSDGQRVIVSDLGHNRVLVWNSIPMQNGQPADFAVGQPDVISTEAQSAQDANNSKFLCPSNGTDTNNNPTYPFACAATLSFPRFAISDGTRLFIADGGNDRVLVYHRMPTQSGQAADAILGQPTEDITEDSSEFRVAAADTVRTPSSLAWDGENLYVSDPFNRRVLVFSMSDEALPLSALRNSASREIFASGAITFSTDPKENDEVTVKIADAREYKYKAVANDKLGIVVSQLAEKINAGAGDPDVVATPNPLFGQVLLSARQSGDIRTSIAVTVSTGAQIQAAVSGATLTGGKETARIAPGTLVTLTGENLADATASAGDPRVLPLELGGVEVYIDGIQAPLLFVSPTQINAQMPFEVHDTTGVTAWVRIRGRDGSVRITNPIGVPVVRQNPGLFAVEGSEPREAVAFHASSSATGVISVDGVPKENDTVSVTIAESREYSYTVQKDDTLEIIRDRLIEKINEDEQVSATAGGVYRRIVLQARATGSEGEGIKYTAKGTDSVLMTPYGSELCCASEAGARITPDNPARPGELITVYATGLGLILPQEATVSVTTGVKYEGPEFNYPNVPVDDAVVGGKTANIIYATMRPGSVGVYEVKLLLNSDIPSNEQTTAWIAQEFYVSNIVTIPVFNPNPPAE